jgi:hypothetical protein
MSPCSLRVHYERFGETYRFHLQCVLPDFTTLYTASVLVKGRCSGCPVTELSTDEAEIPPSSIANFVLRFEALAEVRLLSIQDIVPLRRSTQVYGSFTILN